MGETLMDGTEQTLFESTDLANYNGYVFLNTMLTNDTIIINVYVKDVETNEYRMADTATFEDVQTLPAVRISEVVGKVGIKVTAKQTDGVYRKITHMWFKK